MSDKYPGRKVYGLGAKVTSEQVAQILYQAGLRGQDLINFVGLAMRESGNNYQVRGTQADPSKLTGDFGLFGINAVNDTPAARAAVGYTSRDQWLDPVINAKMAVYLFQTYGMKPWNGGPEGWDANGSWSYGVNLKAAQTAVTNAQQQGLLGQSFQGVGVAGAPTNAPTSAGGPFTLPSDAKIFNNGIGIYAVFDVGGVALAYDLNPASGVQFNTSQVQVVTPQQFGAMNVVGAGDVEELRDLGTTWGTFKQFWDSIISQVMGSTNPAGKDPEVLRVLAEFAGRPDMTAAELNNKLQATQWYQTHTQGELEWNGLADAEKQKRRDTTASQMAQTWFQFTGEAVNPDDPRIANYLEDVSSGKTGLGAWTESVVKKQALLNEQSPWSRQLADESKAQLQQGVDIENTAQRVKDLAKRWGIQWSENLYQDWASKIVKNEASDADVLQTLQQQAKVMYPWLDGTTETATAAQPWVETYNRVMEKQVDLLNPKVQSALTAGKPVWEFEQELKRSSDWLTTKNARDSMFSVVSEAGRRLGFE